jgi:hypothetical protein
MQDEQLGSHWMQMIPAFDDDDDVWITAYNGLHNDALQPAILTRWVEFIDLFVADEVPVIPEAILGFSGVLFEESSGVPAPPVPQSRFATMKSVDEARAAFRRDPRIRVLLDVGAGDLGPGALQPTWEITSDTWPLEGTAATRYQLAADGHLTTDDTVEAGTDSYVADPAARPETSQSPTEGAEPNYQDEPNNWTPVADGKGLGWTSDRLAQDVLIAGTSSLDLWISASDADTDLQATISEVRPDGREMYVETGWLRASHRALDPPRSTAMEPYHAHDRPEPIEPGKVYRLDISLEPMAHRFKQGNRIRLEIVNGDSTVTDVLWTHYYAPNKIGTDTIHHSAEHPSTLTLPVTDGA